MKHYFSRFPVVNYAGVPAKNILQRATLSDATKNNPANFGVVRVPDEGAQRADIISENYYGNPYYDWLVYFSNEVVDPYNDMFKDNETFRAFITTKYGSIQFANEKVMFYINNWVSNPDDTLTVAQFEAASQAVKKYYTAVTDAFNNVTSYRRHRIDWIKSTNRIRILTVDMTDMFVIGSVVVQYVSGVIVAKGEIVDINREDSKISVQHITGEFVTTGGNKLKRYGTNLEYTVSEVSNPLTEDNITNDESVYWSAMTAYDYENELNESRRNIKLLRASMRGAADEQLTNLMRG
jgi:hypothetical protein